jgi:aryl-alcohol dehydrogenase-like predicted oxidoreductase
VTVAIGRLRVGRIALGCYAYTGGYGAAAERDAIATIHAALDAGVDLLDTSDAYAAGENERLVGRAVADRRERAVIATKFGWVLDAAGRPVALDCSPAAVRRSCEASLRRLGTDHVDVTMAHRVDPTVPIEETVGELVRLRDEGKVLEFGLSEAGPRTVERARVAGPLAVLQTEYSMWSRDPESEILPLCERLGVTFMAYSPLGRGFLAGAVRSRADLGADDIRLGHPRFSPENLAHNLALVDRLAAIADERGCTAAQLALAWVLAQPWRIVPIVATRRLEHLAENVAAIDLRLTAAELAEIGAVVAPALVHGERHPADHMKTIGR